MSMHPDVVRSVALDQLARTAKKRGVIAMYYPGRVLATAEPVYPGDSVKVYVPFEEDTPVLFKTDVLYAQWYAPTKEGAWKRGRLYVYENQPEDTARFRAALDTMLEETAK